MTGLLTNTTPFSSKAAENPCTSNQLPGNRSFIPAQSYNIGIIIAADKVPLQGGQKKSSLILLLGLMIQFALENILVSLRLPSCPKQYLLNQTINWKS